MSFPSLLWPTCLPGLTQPLLRAPGTAGAPPRRQWGECSLEGPFPDLPGRALPRGPLERGLTEVKIRVPLLRLCNRSYKKLTSRGSKNTDFTTVTPLDFIATS